MAKIQRTSKSDKAYGRGSDSFYIPARYAVINQHGKQVAEIIGSNARYMEPVNWKVIWNGLVLRFYTREFSSFKEAKAWAMRNF